MSYTLTGAGSVFRTENNGVAVYMARITLKDESTGRKLVVSGVGSTRKQAVERRDKNVEKRLERLGAEQSASELPIVKTRLRKKKHGLTMSEYLPTWHEVQGSRTKQQTKDSQRQRLEQWVFPWLTQPMDQLTLTMLEAHFRTTLPAQGAGESSVYGAFGATKALLTSAVRTGHLKASPAAGLTMKKPTPKVALEDQQLVRKRLSVFKGLLRELAQEDHEHHSSYPLILLMSLGLRRAELLGLEWSAVKGLSRKGHAYLTIHQQLIRLKDGGYVLQPSTKTSKPRTVPLPEAHRKALLELKKKQEAEESERTALAEDLIFVEGGEHLTYSRFTRIWYEALTSYMQKGGRRLREDDLFRPHYTRKLAATLMAESGVPVKVAAEVLGHDASVLLRTYQQVSRDAQREATQALSGSLGL